MAIVRVLQRRHDKPKRLPTEVVGTCHVGFADNRRRLFSATLQVLKSDNSEAR